MCDASRDTLRDLLGEQNPRLDQERGDVLDLATLVLGELHDALRGRVSRLSGARAADYRRGQVTGKYPLTIADLCQLAIDAPDAVSAALIPLRAAVEPEAGTRERGLLSEMADVVTTAAALLEQITSSLRDGRITEREALDGLGLAEAHQRELADVVARLREGLPTWRPEVARRVEIRQSVKGPGTAGEVVRS